MLSRRTTLNRSAITNADIPTQFIYQIPDPAKGTFLFRIRLTDFSKVGMP